MKKVYKKHKIYLRPLIATLLILLFPLLGQIFLDEMNWGLMDFIIMGVLIYITALAVEIANKNIKNNTYKILAILAVIFTLILVWIELATDGVSRWIGIIFGIY